MPIRFRCQHCSQLMGIARRKAGSVVQCPACKKALNVPHADDPDLSPPAKGHQAYEAKKVAEPMHANPFERSDFQLPEPIRVREALVEQTVAAEPEHVEIDVEPVGLVRTRRQAAGVVLTPSRVAILTVVVLVLLAVAFAVGVMVGRSSSA